MASLLQHARWVAFDSHKADHASVRQIKRISRAAPLSLFIEALETDGCVVVKDFTDIATLAKADREVRPYLEQQGDGVKVGGTVPILHS
jgi:hypothetical protein